MIVVDTSALLAVVLGEEQAAVVMKCLQSEPDIVISGGILAEALIVGFGRNVRGDVQRLITELNIRTIPVTDSAAADAPIVLNAGARA